MPGKPFSGKAKKAQLQAKRQSKRDQRDRDQFDEQRARATADGTEEAAVLIAEAGDDHQQGQQQHQDYEAPDFGRAKQNKKPDRVPAAPLAERTVVTEFSPGPQVKVKGPKVVYSFGGRPKKEEQERHDLRTVFERESKADIEDRKHDALRPLDLDKRSKPWSILKEYLTTDYIDIPKRPHWEYGTSKAEVERIEQQAFREWLDGVYAKYPRERLNYFEHNLEVWRQLWRVVERSDLVLLLTDARFPLFHFPPALYNYVVNEWRKTLLLVLNKQDLVNKRTIEAWVSYFHRHYPEVKIVAFNAFALPTNQTQEIDVSQKRKLGRRRYETASGVDELLAVVESLLDQLQHEQQLQQQQQQQQQQDKQEHQSAESVAHGETAPPQHQDGAAKPVDGEARGSSQQQEAQDVRGAKPVPAESALPVGPAASTQPDGSSSTTRAAARQAEPDAAQRDESGDASADEEYHPATGSSSDSDEEEASGTDDDDGDASDSAASASDGDHADEAVHDPRQAGGVGRREGPRIVGTLGHPNVGKSSLINALKGKKVVSTSRTPGHTKHFQTITLTPTLTLCDCPGLVFPATDRPKALQILCGLFPLAQVREPYSAIRYLAERVPLETVYNLKLPEGTKQWSPWAICEAFALQQGYLTARSGRADTHRAGLEILKDCLDGRIAISWPPPDAADSLGDSAAPDDQPTGLLQAPRRPKAAASGGSDELDDGERPAATGPLTREEKKAAKKLSRKQPVPLVQAPFSTTITARNVFDLLGDDDAPTHSDGSGSDSDADAGSDPEDDDGSAPARQDATHDSSRQPIDHGSSSDEDDREGRPPTSAAAKEARQVAASQSGGRRAKKQQQAGQRTALPYVPQQQPKRQSAPKVLSKAERRKAAKAEEHADKRTARLAGGPGL